MTLPASGQLDINQIYSEYWGTTDSGSKNLGDMYYKYQGRSSSNNDMDYFHGWQVYPQEWQRTYGPDNVWRFNPDYTVTNDPGLGNYDYTFRVDTSLGNLYNVNYMDVSIYVKESWWSNYSNSAQLHGVRLDWWNGSSTFNLFDTRATRTTEQNGEQYYAFSCKNVYPFSFQIRPTHRTPPKTGSQYVGNQLEVQITAVWIQGTAKKAVRIKPWPGRHVVQTYCGAEWLGIYDYSYWGFYYPSDIF